MLSAKEFIINVDIPKPQSNSDFNNSQFDAEIIHFYFSTLTIKHTYIISDLILLVLHNFDSTNLYIPSNDCIFS